MLTFLLLLLPLGFLLYCLEKKDKQILIPALIGFACAIVLCAFRAFLSFSHRVIPYSFGSNFGYYVVQDIIMPVILCAAFYFVSKDSWEYKVNSFFPLMCSFYIIYLPFSVISRTETVVYSGYDLFIKPVICLAMLYQLAASVKLFYEGIKEKYVLKIFLNVVVILAYIIIPLILDTLYIMGYPFAMVLGLSILYVVSSILFSVGKILNRVQNK